MLPGCSPVREVSLISHQLNSSKWLSSPWFSTVLGFTFWGLLQFYHFPWSFLKKVLGNTSLIGECTAFQPLSASRNLGASLLFILYIISVSFNLAACTFSIIGSFKNVVCVLLISFQQIYLLKAIPTITFQTCLSF